MGDFGKRSPGKENSGGGGEDYSARAIRVFNVILIICLLTPVAVALGMFGSVSFHLWRAFPQFDPLLSQMESAQKKGGVVSGDNPRVLKRLFLRLEKMAALSAEAKRADILHLGFVDFDEMDAQLETERGRSAGISPLRSKAVKQVALDLSGIKTAAVVLIANRPVVWQVEGARSDQRAKIGFEGPFAFDLVGGHQGLLAGFRVSAFGGGKTASPRDLKNIGEKKFHRRLFCANAKRWQRYFDVPEGKIFIWHIRNPRKIQAGFFAVSGDGNGNPKPRKVWDFC